MQRVKEKERQVMRVYLYHESKAPKVVDYIDKDNHEGWKDSPLSFVKTTDFGVNPDETEKVQAIGESIAGITEYCNAMLNLNLMTMKELREFAKKHFNGKIKAKSKRALIKKIEAEDGNSSGYH